jgi:Protein of unknown function (DUF3224)
MNAKAKFKIESWEEQPYAEGEEGSKLTRATVLQSFSGEIEGEGSFEWLLCYRPDQTADFVGMQRVSGHIGERSGTVVLQTTGTFDGTEARGDWIVVPGSGTGALRGLRGRGGFAAPQGLEAAVTLDYDFE